MKDAVRVDIRRTKIERRAYVRYEFSYNPNVLKPTFCIRDAHDAIQKVDET